jgi:uncharacterized protein YkwD
MRSRLLSGLACAAAVVLGAPAATATAAGSDFLAPPSACPHQNDSNLPVEVQEAAMACLVNRARDEADLVPLSRDPRLMDSAAQKARDVVTCGEFSHTACHLPFAERIVDADYAFRRVGENLGYGTGGAGSPRSIMADWLASPAHRANILTPAFREQGVGLVDVGGAQVWVGHFARGR